MIIELGDIYALSSAATFAISSAMIKRLNIIGSVPQLNFLRTLIGAVIFLAHLLLINQFNQLFDISGLIILYLSLSVIFNIVLGDTAFFESQNRLGVKIATPLVNTFPFFTIIFAVLLLNETVTETLVIGALILIPGIILLSIDKIEDEASFLEGEEKHEQDRKDRKNRIIGLFLILFAIGCYTAGIIYTTIATRDIGPVLANSIRLPVGTMGLFILSSSIGNRQNKLGSEISWSKFVASIKRSSRSEKLIILVTGIFGTYLSSLFLVLSVQSIGASRSAILFSTGPFFSLPLAIFWLKERIGYKTVLGTLLTVTGLWIIL